MKKRVRPVSVAPVSQGRKPLRSRKPKEYPRLNRSLEACWADFSRIISNAPRSPASLVLTANSMQQMWVEHLIRWSYYYDPSVLERIGRILGRERRITPEQLEYLRQLKNMGDDLRHFFQLFSVSHRVPKPIQALVKMVGQIRDQVRLNEGKRAARQAGELLRLLAASGKIHWPELQVNPVAMRAFLRERIAAMLQLLDRTQMTAHDFHQVKKDFRLIFSVYFYLHPRAAQAPLRRNAFVAAKMAIKKMNRVLLADKYRRAVKYRDIMIVLPSEFRMRVWRFINSIKITAQGD
jgi:hypothetical protein